MKYKQMREYFPVDKAWTSQKDIEFFLRECADLAFGENAIERGFLMEEVLEKLKEFSNNALKYEEGEE
tara:strand:+ start:289 stop:492 length:204 start_codon:yes stop_codon:yes gene_type:complete